MAVHVLAVSWQRSRPSDRDLCHAIEREQLGPGSTARKGQGNWDYLRQVVNSDREESIGQDAGRIVCEHVEASGDEGSGDLTSYPAA